MLSLTLIANILFWGLIGFVLGPILGRAIVGVFLVLTSPILWMAMLAGLMLWFVVQVTLGVA